VFPGAGTGPAAGSMQRKLAQSYSLELKGLRPRAPPTGAGSAPESTEGSVTGSGTGSGKPTEGVTGEEAQGPRPPRDRPPAGAEAEEGRVAPAALKHVPWALREENPTPGAFLRWPLGGEGAGREVQETTSAGPKPAPGSVFPTLKHIPWNLEDEGRR